MPATKPSKTYQHCAILLSNSVDKKNLITKLLDNDYTIFSSFLNNKNGLVFSDQAIKEIVMEEERHDVVLVGLSCHPAGTSQQRKLKTFSSGERKKLFLEHCLAQNPDFLILDNPLDHLDIGARKLLKDSLNELKDEITLVQLANRKADILEFIDKRFQFDQDSGQLLPLKRNNTETENGISTDFASLMTASEDQNDELIKLERISLAYGEKKVLDDLSWALRPNEFWQLIGPNGSGKSSLLALITGDNVKGYGQEVYLFGTKKGSGESVWDIKKKIGYFSVAVLDLFRSDDKVVDMVLSGFYDSIGLYVKPTDVQKNRARQWLTLAGLGDKIEERFSKLSEGGQRIVLILRAVIKNPPLVLLDEPVEGLDEENAQWVIQLINTLVKKTAMTVVYISHRSEPGLKGANILELIPGPNGSTGKISKQT